MSIWRRNGNGNGNGNGASHELQSPVRVLPALPAAPRDRYQGEAGMVWRCGRCGSMGTSPNSLSTHVWGDRSCTRADITEYVPREVYEREYEHGEEARRAELALSGIWIVVKMPEQTEEGSVAANYESEILNASSGLEAIKAWYTQQIAELTPDSTERDREEANGRYVAIDFFTGIRCEAKVFSDWRAEVEIAEGSIA